MKYKLSRIIYNLRRYGFFITIKKIILRLFKLNKKNNKSQEELYQLWIKNNEPTVSELYEQIDTKFDYSPKISIVVPMYNPNENLFLKLIKSVAIQTYENWELCIADRK